MRGTSLLLLSALACTPDRDTGETAQPAAVPDLATGGCGMAAYDWVALEGMGAVVDADDADDLSIGSAAIDFLLESYGITQFSPLSYDVQAWRIRYVTQDRGQSVEATMVFTMPDVDDGSSFPIVAFPHGTSGFTDFCAPSAGGMENSALPIVFSAMGYAVAAPDYLGMAGFGEPSGMLHPYLVPEATAVATLDSIRAAQAFVTDEQPGAGIDLQQTVLWGGSEGGFAAQWAELYQPHYLPEASVAATVALVPPTDLTAIALAGLRDPIAASGGLVGAWVGQHSWYDVADHDLSEVLHDSVAAAIAQEMLESCSDFPSGDGATTLEEVFQPAALEAAASGDLDSLEPWSCYLGLADLHGARVPRTTDPPVLLVVSEDDDLVVADTVRDSIPTLCADGYDIDYLECAGADHSEGAVLTLPYQLEWVADRLAGVPLADDQLCVVEDPIECEQFLELEE